MSPQIVSEETRADLAKAYRKASGPFSIPMDDQPDLIVMSSSDIDVDEIPFTEAETSALSAGYAAAQRGEIVNAREAVHEMRMRYGL